jgi:microsomal dipeptidase-like Zn-dependent dipeptidase
LLRFFHLLFFFSLGLSAQLVHAQEIREFMDMQIHTAMHIPYCFFGEGLQYFAEDDPPNLKYKHRFKNVNYANFFERNDGARIFVNGTILPELIASKKRARRLTLEQIRFVEDFTAAHPDEFAVAKTPAEVRELLKTTDKTIFIHSIEGAKRLINSREDAQFWAGQGVAFITLMHLVDSEHGASGIKPGFLAGVINFKGTFKKLFGAAKKRGLKEKGKNAIRWLAEAGIMTDITHMSELTREDALQLMEEENIPPLATHELFRPIQNHVRGLSKDDISRIYQMGGFIALPISGEVLEPYRPQEIYRQSLDTLQGHCPGSIDEYKFTYLAVKSFLESELSTTLFNRPFPALNEAEKTQLALGFQSDFNGWLNHSRPRYGKKGCYQGPADGDLSALATQGLAHPGLLGEQWSVLREEGVDLTPIKRASEKFLQLWQHFLDNRKSSK